MMKNKTDSEKVSLGFFIGAVVGSAAFYLYGTKKGAETRKLVNQEFAAIKTQYQPQIETALAKLKKAGKKATAIVEAAESNSSLVIPKSVKTVVKGLFTTAASVKAPEKKRYFKKR